MNRLVREHYPVSKLPEDLREGFHGLAEVRVTIDAIGPSASGKDEASPMPSRTLEELFAMGRPTFRTVEEIDDHLQALREEWE